MAGGLPYHYIDDDVILSLNWVAPSESEAEDVVEDFASRDRPSHVNVHSHIQPHEFNEVLWAVYIAEEWGHSFPSGWEQRLPDDDLVLVDAVINTFRGVGQAWRDRGQPLKWYKQPQPESVANALEHVQWRQSVPEVGGSIISDLILKHCLPNANHRTAVAFLRTYLESIDHDTQPDLPPAGNYEGDWHEWARGYVHESKRLLLLRRKPELLGHAKQFGCNVVRRKSGVEVDLTAHDFFDPEIKSMAEEAHENRSVQFVKNYLTRSGYPGLCEMEDPGKRTFVDRLR